MTKQIDIKLRKGQHIIVKSTKRAARFVRLHDFNNGTCAVVIYEGERRHRYIDIWPTLSSVITPTH